MEKEKMTYEQMCNPSYRRKELMETKQGAIWQVFFELDGIINISKFTKQYFKKSHAWFSQRVNGYDVNHKRAEFTAEEYNKIAASFRDLANRLDSYADELDRASLTDFQEDS